MYYCNGFSIKISRNGMHSNNGCDTGKKEIGALSMIDWHIGLRNLRCFAREKQPSMFVYTYSVEVKISWKFPNGCNVYFPWILYVFLPDVNLSILCNDNITYIDSWNFDLIQSGQVKTCQWPDWTSQRAWPFVIRTRLELFLEFCLGRLNDLLLLNVLFLMTRYWMW